jgi:methylphosphotriester-DNA--protein-cysteine methyltransferase
MIHHIEIGTDPQRRKTELRRLIADGTIKLGGHRPGKIYGTLSCASGKRMKAENRVFFESEQEAINAGYRPCGHCMPEKYKAWKAGKSRYSSTRTV